MAKKFLTIALTITFVLPTFALALNVSAASKVCGVDNVTYDSADDALAIGIDVSYNSPCVNVASEDDLYEAKKDISINGALVEIGSTDIPTTIIVRDNKGGQDYTVEVSQNTILGQKKDQATKLSDWIPGDQIKVVGKLNENTNVVEASLLANTSIKINTNIAANGWITNIDKEKKEITYQWANKSQIFAYDENTKFAVAGKNPASVDDLKKDDRIRGRLLFREGQTPLAKIIVVLRRGPDLFMKIRTFQSNAVLTRLDSTIVPTTIQVKSLKTPGLKANDVNNLVGTEGQLITVNVTENTRIVRKYFGKTTLTELSVGDNLFIVGRVNDDGTIDAKLVKDNSIWMSTTQGHAGIVKEVNVSGNYLMMDWTPIKLLPQNKLKEKLTEKKNMVIAQAVNVPAEGTSTAPVKPILNKIQPNPVNIQKIKNQIQKGIANPGGMNLKNLHLNQGAIQKLKNQLQKASSTPGINASSTLNAQNRNIQFKKVLIDRIKQSNVKVGDLVKRGNPISVKVQVNPKTKIVVGTNVNAQLADIKVGDKIRVVGVRHEGKPVVVNAITIVVTNSLPEIEESLNMPLDEVNQVVTEIISGNNSLLTDAIETVTEEVVDNNTLSKIINNETIVESGDASIQPTATAPAAVCCESYGLGALGTECCQKYKWATSAECSAQLLGGGQKIVDNSVCSGYNINPGDDWTAPKADTPAKVCCESYGLGAMMVPCCQKYKWTYASECATPEGLVGGGQKIVDNSVCEQNSITSETDWQSPPTTAQPNQ